MVSRLYLNGGEKSEITGLFTQMELFGVIITSHSRQPCRVGPSASSFDSEIAALESALTCELGQTDKTNLHFFIGNKGVVQFFLQMQMRSSQTVSLRINMLLQDLSHCAFPPFSHALHTWEFTISR